MPRKKTYKFIQNRLRESSDMRDAFNFIDAFNQYESMYRGENEQEYTKNLYYSIFTSIIASTYLRNPRIIITSDDYRDALKAKVIQKIHNRWIANRESGVKKTMRRITLDILLSALGIVQVGSGGRFGRDPDIVLQSLQNNFGDAFDFEPDKSGDELHSVSDEDIWMDRIHPTMILMPAENIGADVRTMEFIAKRYYRRLSHVKKDRRYKGVKGLELKTTRFGESNNGSMRGQNSVSDNDFVELIDYFCNETKLIYTVIVGHDKIIKIEDMVTSTLPFVIFNWTEDSSYPYPQPDAAVLFDKQMDYNEVVDQERFLRRTHKMMVFVDKNKLDHREVEEMQDASNPRGIIYTNGSPNDSVLFGKYGVGGDTSFAKRDIEADGRSELGFSKNSAGESMGGRTSAAETRIIGSGSQLRNNERRDILLSGIQDAFEIADEFRAEFWKTERDITINGEQEPIVFTGETLYSPRGDLSYNATMYDARQENVETQRVLILQVYDRLVQAGIPQEELVGILQEAFPEISALMDMQGIIDSLVQQRQSQQQQQIQQAQEQLQDGRQQ